MIGDVRLAFQVDPDEILGLVVLEGLRDQGQQIVYLPFRSIAGDDGCPPLAAPSQGLSVGQGVAPRARTSVADMGCRFIRMKHHAGGVAPARARASGCCHRKRRNRVPACPVRTDQE